MTPGLMETAELVAEHGGRYVAIDHAPEVVEGDPGLRSVVLLELPDVASARGLVRTLVAPTRS